MRRYATTSGLRQARSGLRSGGTIWNRRTLEEKKIDCLYRLLAELKLDKVDPDTAFHHLLQLGRRNKLEAALIRV